MKTTQVQIIKNHLIEFGHISGKEAFDLYGVYRLSEVIRKLRSKGFVINTVMRPTTTKMGINTEYGVYYWGIQKDEEVPFMGVES